MTPARRAQHRQEIAALLQDPTSYPSTMLKRLTEHRDLPKLWGMRALDLKFAADELRRQADALSRRFDESAAGNPEYAVTAQPGLATIASLYDTATMLLGLAFENMIKGIIVSRDRSLVRNGTLMKQLAKHNVAELARSHKIVTEPDDLHLLEVLESYVLWLGRYPMPLKPDEWLDLIPHEFAGDDPLRFDEARANALFDALVQHADMKWYP